MSETNRDKAIKQLPEFFLGPWETLAFHWYNYAGIEKICLWHRPRLSHSCTEVERERSHKEDTGPWRLFFLRLGS